MNTATYSVAAGLFIESYGKRSCDEVGPTDTRPLTRLSRLVLNTDGGHIENCTQAHRPMKVIDMPGKYGEEQLRSYQDLRDLR